VWARDPDDVGKRQRRKQVPITQKESQKWLTSLEAASRAREACAHTRVISVGDREADVFDLLAMERPAGVDLLVRAAWDRCVEGPEHHIWATVEAQPVLEHLRLQVPSRGAQPGRQATRDAGCRRGPGTAPTVAEDDAHLGRRGRAVQVTVDAEAIVLVAVGVGIGPTAIDAVLGVVKAYTTRVGNGPLPTEAEPKVAERIRELGGEFGATTGRPRRCGWFDAVVVRYAVRVNGLTGLAVTKLDVLDTFAEIPVCVGYRLDGETIDSMPADLERIERVEPIYETLQGWGKELTEARRLADLPAAARAYVDRLQDLAGAPVRYVSVGTRRDQIIEVA